MLNRIAFFTIFITSFCMANEQVTNPMIESIEFRGDYSNINAEGIQDNEIRFNFNGKQASKALKNSYNNYLDLESKQINNNQILESEKLIINLSSLEKLIKETKFDLQKIKLINIRDVNSKYKERRLREELKILKDEYQYLNQLIQLKNISKKHTQFKVPQVTIIKQLNFKDSLSFKILSKEENILKEQENIKNGMQFVSVTNNMQNEKGIKFGYAFQFGEGAKDSFRRIRERRQIKKTLKDYEVEFFTIKYNLLKSINKYTNASQALKRASKKVKNTRDKNLVLSELFNLSRLRKEAYSEKINLLNYLTGLQSYWGEVI